MKRRINRMQQHYMKLVKEHGGGYKEVAELAGVSVPSISRIVSGKTSPGVAQVQSLALELGKEAGARLIADFCRDLIPKGLRRQVRIRVMTNNTRCLSTERLPESFEFLPKSGQRMIEKLIQLCLENSELLDHFIEEIDLLYDPSESSPSP